MQPAGGCCWELGAADNKSFMHVVSSLSSLRVWPLTHGCLTAHTSYTRTITQAQVRLY